MLSSWLNERWMAAAPVLLAGSLVTAHGGEIEQVSCNCRRGGGQMMMMPGAMYAPPAWQAPNLLPVPPAAVPTTPVPEAVAPPPGTLGRSYQIPTRLVPADKHPRVAMLDVHVTGVDDVVVSSTNEYREDSDVKGYQDEEDPSVWHFETKPLVPGIPYVYKVETYKGKQVQEVRYVRMLRGRIIDLTF